MNGIFRAAIAAVVAKIGQITPAIKVTTDPRQARPGVVFLEMPTFDGFNANVADMTITARILAPGAGNQNSSDFCLLVADQLLAADLAVISGRPTAAIIGDQTLAAYDLVIRVAVQR